MKAIICEIYILLLPECTEVLVGTKKGTERCALRKSPSCLHAHLGLLHIWASCGRRAWWRGDGMLLASYKIYELLNLEMSFCYCLCTAGIFVWVTKKKIAITSFARTSMSNTKWFQLIILTTEFTLDKQSVYQMICPRKVVILTKCYSLQLCSSHYRIANSFLKEKTVQAKY